MKLIKIKCDLAPRDYVLLLPGAADGKLVTLELCTGHDSDSSFVHVKLSKLKKAIKKMKFEVAKLVAIKQTILARVYSVNM